MTGIWDVVLGRAKADVKTIFNEQVFISHTIQWASA
jgi:small basic protein